MGGFFQRLFRGSGRRHSPASGHTKEEGLAAYVIREHGLGRSVADILDDAYLKNRTTEEERLRLLERPEVIRAIGENTAAEARETVRRPD